MMLAEAHAHEAQQSRTQEAKSGVRANEQHRADADERERLQRTRGQDLVVDRHDEPRCRDGEEGQHQGQDTTLQKDLAEAAENTPEPIRLRQQDAALAFAHGAEHDRPPHLPGNGNLPIFAGFAVEHQILSLAARQKNIGRPRVRHVKTRQQARIDLIGAEAHAMAFEAKVRHRVEGASSTPISLGRCGSAATN